MQSEDSSSVDGDNDQDSDQDNDREIEDSEDEFWKDIPGDVLDQDISSPPPLPTPERKWRRGGKYSGVPENFLCWQKETRDPRIVSSFKLKDCKNFIGSPTT